MPSGISRELYDAVFTAFVSSSTPPKRNLKALWPTDQRFALISPTVLILGVRTTLCWYAVLWLLYRFLFSAIVCEAVACICLPSKLWYCHTSLSTHTLKAVLFAHWTLHLMDPSIKLMITWYVLVSFLASRILSLEMVSMTCILGKKIWFHTTKYHPLVDYFVNSVDIHSSTMSLIICSTYHSLI